MAEAIVNTASAAAGADRDELATKADLAEVRAAIAALKADMPKVAIGVAIGVAVESRFMTIPPLVPPSPRQGGTPGPARDSICGAGGISPFARGAAVPHCGPASARRRRSHQRQSCPPAVRTPP